MKPILLLFLITIILCGHSKDEWRDRVNISTFNRSFLK